MSMRFYAVIVADSKLFYNLSFKPCTAPLAPQIRCASSLTDTVSPINLLTYLFTYLSYKSRTRRDLQMTVTCSSRAHAPLGSVSEASAHRHQQPSGTTFLQNGKTVRH